MENKKNNNNHIAACGLDCSSCSAFIATRDNDDNLREKTAQEWTKKYGYNSPEKPLEKEDINCRGCLSDGPFFARCLECKIRKCGIEKGIKNCKSCEEYKCDKLKELQSHFF